MITARIIEYWNDYRKKEKRERFESLDRLADWIFDQMQVDYSGEKGWLSLSFPKCETMDTIYEITVRPEHRGATLWIKQIEDDCRGIIFSDGTFTAGKKHCTREVREWLAKCGERKKNPVFNFAPDVAAPDAPHAGETVLGSAIKRAACRIHAASRCEAGDEYSRGYGDAAAFALDILLEETGFRMEEIPGYGEHGGM